MGRLLSTTGFNIFDEVARERRLGAWDDLNVEPHIQPDHINKKAKRVCVLVVKTKKKFSPFGDLSTS